MAGSGAERPLPEGAIKAPLPALAATLPAVASENQAPTDDPLAQRIVQPHR